MRFEELLRYNGPVRHVDHSFRVSLHKNASTEGSEAQGWQFTRPNLKGIEWVKLVGYENPDENPTYDKNNKDARLWGRETSDVNLLEASDRYGGTPKYATPDEKKQLAENLNNLPSDADTINDLNVFIRYLNWLQWNTRDFKLWERSALEQAEKASWSALKELFTSAVNKLKTEAAETAIGKEWATADGKFAESAALSKKPKTQSKTWIVRSRTLKPTIRNTTRPDRAERS